MELAQDLSTLGPVARVFAICDSMPGASRKEIIAACVAAGVNESTARQQYKNWLNPEKFAEKKAAWRSAYYHNRGGKEKNAEYNARPEVKTRLADKYHNRGGKAQKAAYFQKNRTMHYAHRTAYRALKLNATPAWLTDADRAATQELYAESVFLTQSTGQPYHVDHILPLKGKIVCGLHVPKNLRVMPGSENISKGNRLTPEDLRMVEAATLADAQRACADDFLHSVYIHHTIKP